MVALFCMAIVFAVLGIVYVLIRAFSFLMRKLVRSDTEESMSSVE